MVSFYVNNVLINVSTNASIVYSQDESLDTATFELEWSQVPNAIFPGTPFKVVDSTNNKTDNFVVLSDEVEIVQKSNPVRYLHKLLVTQNTHLLKKYLVRNTVFSQPLRGNARAMIHAMGFSRVQYTTANGYVAESYIAFQRIDYDNEGGFPTTRIQVSEREKIASATLKIKVRQTTAYENIESLGADNVLEDPKTPRANVVKNIHLTITRYETATSTTILNQETIEVPNDENEISIPLSAFHGAGYYEMGLDLSDTNRPYLDTASLSSNYIVYYRNGDTPQDYEVEPVLFCEFKASLEFETYYYTLYDVLRVLCRQSEKRVDGVETRNTFNIMPLSSTQGQFLNNIIAPEFNFTGKDLFSCISEVLSYIDAVPTLDSNKVLGFEYLNDANGSLDKDFIDVKTTINDEYYTNKMVTTYQNGKQPTYESYPDQVDYRGLSFKDYGILQIENLYIDAPNPINEIRGLYFNFNGNIQLDVIIRLLYPSGHNPTVTFETSLTSEDELDVTSSVFEESLYLLLDEDFPENRGQNKNNCVYYSQNSLSFSVGGTVKKANNTTITKLEAMCLQAFTEIYGANNNTAWFGVTDHFHDFFINHHVTDIYYRLEYFGNYDGQTTVESQEGKFDGESYVNQSNANVSLNKMGTNLMGLSLRTGNESKAVATIITSFATRVQKGNVWVDSNNNKWIANKVKITFSVSSDKVINELELVKNFNNLSQFTQVDQERRFYEISESITSKGYENLNNYIYFSTNDITSLAEETPISDFALDVMVGGTLSGDYDQNIMQFDVAYIKTYDYPYYTENLYKNSVYIPLHVYGGGNVINFEMGYQHPLNAGNRIVYENNKYYGKATMYVGEDGFADSIKFSIGHMSIYGSAKADYPLRDPNIVAYNNIEFRYDYYKKPNEILHFNYGVAFLPYFTYTTNAYGLKIKTIEEIYFGELLITQNGIIPNNAFSYVGRKTYFYYSNTETYSIRETKALGTKVDDANIGRASDVSHSGYIRVSLPSQIASCKSWAIGDENGNLYLAVNQELKNFTSTTLYYATKKTRFS